MSAWLTEAWAKEVSACAAQRPAAPGAEGIVEVAVSGGPEGEVRYHWTYAGGVPVAGQAGRAPAPDLAFSVTAADARALLRGEVEPSVAFMRGRLKATGDGGLLLAVLGSTTTGGFEVWRQRCAALGEPGD